MDYQILKLSIDGPVALITISRPEALNALNSRFFAEMDSMLAELREHDSLRALVITGEGKAFVAGADISEMSGMDPKQGRSFSITGQNTFRSLEKMNIPVIAAVNGFALGGGCELALACDIRIASIKAKFGQPEVNLGLIPGYAGTQRLPRLVGLGNALHLLLTADMIGAEDALRMGLVQKVTEPEDLLDEALSMAKKIATKGPQAVRLVKEVSRKGLMMDFDSGCSLESDQFGSLFAHEAKEGMAAFLEKRPPNF